MGQVRTTFILILFFSASLSGCLSNEPTGEKIDLLVNYELNNGTVVESYSNGELTFTSEVTLDFDFSQTTADSKLVTYGLDKMDGSSPTTVNANSATSVSVEFSNHGIYNLTAYAIDENGEQKNLTIPVRIELRIEWVETNTNNPQTLVFDPTPSNGGQHALMIEVYSTVENPSLINDISGGGQSVEFTWNIADEQDDICQSRSGQVEDGEAEFWNTIHFNTYGIHELRINYDEGQDSISINQSVSIIYES
ncbi:MAG: Uncharacterised protein [Methanobacteriota archaeon]|nr:MAG: Uncharacterised protein [Euryarchaeota archaeon]